jgi:thiamine-monophosphate kinase
MARTDERSRIAMIARLLSEHGVVGGRSPSDLQAAGIELGIGDDAAVLRGVRASSRLCWTIDEQVDGVHFRRDLASVADIGWRSYMAAASDVAAMGGVPWCALCAMVLPEDLDDSSLEEMILGQRDAADRIAAPVVGGNLSRGATLSLATTLLGTCEHPVARGGALPGDGLWLAGRVGIAAAGFRALHRARHGRESLEPAVEAWRRPRALVEEGRAMAGVAHAAIDVSDGLARDAGHLADASGVCLVLDGGALLSDAVLVSAAAALGEDALDLALTGGEDYALLAASSAPIPGFRRIGSVRGGRGLVLVVGGRERAIEPAGFDHFGSSPDDSK